LPYHSGSHRQYSQFVEQRLEIIQQDAINDDLSNVGVYNRIYTLAGELRNYLRTLGSGLLQ